ATAGRVWRLNPPYGAALRPGNSRGPGHVPTPSGALSLRSVAMTERATMRPVRGLSDGTFSIDMVKRAESASTSMVWQLRLTAGAAQMSIMGRSGPMPASEGGAATLALAGEAQAGR